MNDNKRANWGLTLIVTVIALIINVPVIVMILNSLRPTAEILARQSYLPSHPSLDNFVHLLTETPFLTYLRNSVITSLGATAFSLVCGVFAGYALSRYKNGLLSVYSTSLFAIQMFPLILALIPLFVLFRSVGLVDHPLSVIIVYGVVNLPFVTWMAQSYFDTIPRELEEAGLIDGCGTFGTFFRIVLPLCAPGLAAVSIFAFLFAYNEYFVANVFLRSKEVLTLPIGIQSFMQQFTTDWGSITGSATMTLLPTLILFLFVQKFITHGAIAGGVKG